jgi:peptide/nickel transport system ATP-binding protein
MALLEVKNLSTSFFTDAGQVRAVRGVSFSLDEGKTLGLVGESGCGKSVTALSVMRLVPFPGRIIGGEVLYREKNLLTLSDKAMQEVRGNEIAMIFQEPLTALNPVFSIGFQIQEAIRIHQSIGKKQALARSLEMLESVGIPETEKTISGYPHQLSGGMRQRAMIAMALSCNPEILIADEPTTALDVTIQAQILELIASIQKQKKMSMILITHDLGIVADRVDDVAIMYCGKIVEYAPSSAVISQPLHPYTIGLLESIPAMDRDKSKPLKTIKGVVPKLLDLPKGCAFCDRCFKADSLCHEREPEALEVKKNHWVACHHVRVER